MKKMMTAMMAAAMMLTTGTALAATPERGYCRDNAPCVEADYTCCGGGYYGGGRGGYGCGGGYCWGNENNNEG